MENTQRFCPGKGRCKFLHKYKISSGGRGVGMEINSLVNLQVFLYLPKFFWGKNEADHTWWWNSCLFVSRPTEAISTHVQTKISQKVGQTFNLQVFLYLPNFLGGKNEADQTWWWNSCLFVSRPTEAISTHVQTKKS